MRLIFVQHFFFLDRTTHFLSHNFYKYVRCMYLCVYAQPVESGAVVHFVFFFICTIFYLFECCLLLLHSLSLSPSLSVDFGDLRFSRFPIRFISYCLQQYYFSWCFIYFVCRFCKNFIFTFVGLLNSVCVLAYFFVLIFLYHNHGMLDGPFQ